MRLNGLSYLMIWEKMVWIENVSYEDIKEGLHFDAGSNSMLIQIVDPDMDFPTPKYDFKLVYQVKFLDVENDETVGIVYKEAINDEHATILADALTVAKNNNMNVIVHCVAGLCRSGAVVEVGTMMGFQDTEKFRAPNVMVKKMLMNKLGVSYE